MNRKRIVLPPLDDPMNPSRYPRTMQQAFGPYTDRVLSGPSERSWRLADVTIISIALAVVIGLLAGVFG